MTEIPESLLRRSAEAKAKALGLPVEQVLAEMKGEAPPTPPPAPEPAPEDQSGETVAAEMEESAERSAEIEEPVEAVDAEPAPKEEVPAEPAAESESEADAETEPEVVAATEADVPPAPPTEAPPAADGDGEDVSAAEPDATPPAPPPAELPPEAGEAVEPAAAAWPPQWKIDRPLRATAVAMAPATAVGKRTVATAPVTAGKVAAVVSTRPGSPEGHARRGADPASAHRGQGPGHPDGQGRANGQGQHLAPPDAHGVRGPARHHRSPRDHVCDHPLPAARPGQLQRHSQPVEGAVVLPRPPGTALLLRSPDRGGDVPTITGFIGF